MGDGSIIPVQIGLQYNKSSICVVYRKNGAEKLRVYRIAINHITEDTDLLKLAAQLRKRHPEFLSETVVSTEQVRL